MKYKVVANGTDMGAYLTGLQALNLVCNILQGNAGILHVQVYYLSEANGKPCWKFENGFKI